MIECHPVLRPFVNAAKPVMHAVRHWHPYRHVVGVRHAIRHAVHHVHRTVASPPPLTTVMTVCHRIAGPILAGGIALLPPASGVPGLGGVGGFPGGFPSEYGAPGFYGAGPYAGGGPGFPAGGILAPVGYYGPNGFGPNGVGPNALGPTTAPILFAQVPDNETIPTMPSPAVMPAQAPPGAPSITPPIMPPGTPPASPPGQGTAPGNETPAPEPASIALLGGIVVVVVAWRAKRNSARRG